jgi:hypothetical protein
VRAFDREGERRPARENDVGRARAQLFFFSFFSFFSREKRRRRRRRRINIGCRKKKKPAGQIAPGVPRREIRVQEMRAKRVVFRGAQSDAEDNHDREEEEFIFFFFFWWWWFW